MAQKYSWDVAKAPTFGSRLKRFLIKTAVLAGGGAGAFGTGYHYYGTNEDITSAKIERVAEIAGETGAAPIKVIHTDKGIFVNEPTKAYAKDATDVAIIDKVLVAGNTVNLKVYGATPEIFGLVPSDIGFHRNIRKVSVVEAAPTDKKLQPPTVEEQAAVKAPAPEVVETETPQQQAIAKAGLLLKELGAEGVCEYHAEAEPKVSCVPEGEREFGSMKMTVNVSNFTVKVADIEAYSQGLAEAKRVSAEKLRESGLTPRGFIFANAVSMSKGGTTLARAFAVMQFVEKSSGEGNVSIAFSQCQNGKCELKELKNTGETAQSLGLKP